MSIVYEPVNHWIYVRPDKVKKLGRLDLPESQEYYPGTATVLAVGPGPFVQQGIELPMPCRVGDRILFQVYRENWHKPHEHEVCMVRADQVICVIKGEPEQN